MIIYGIKNIRHERQVHQATCPNCKRESPILIEAYSRNLHVFWMSLAPLSNEYVAYCMLCQKPIERKKMSLELKELGSKAAGKVRYTYKNFLAMIVLPVLVASLIGGFLIHEALTADQRKQEAQAAHKKNIAIQEERITNPKVNHVYIVTLNDTTINNKQFRLSYALLVNKINADSVSFVPFRTTLVREFSMGKYTLSTMETDLRFYDTEQQFWYSKAIINDTRKIFNYPIEVILQP